MRAESWTMWVIVSSWRLRGYCRRKWPSWIQVALSIPLRSPARLATPLSLAPCSLFLFPRCPPRPFPPSALFAPSNRSFRLAFPSFIHAQHPMLRCFRSLLSCTPILPLHLGRMGGKRVILSIFSLFLSDLLELNFFILFLFFFFDYSINEWSPRFPGSFLLSGKKGRK